MIVNPKARTVELKGKPPTPFKVVSTRKATPPGCWSCGKATDKIAKISTSALVSGSIDIPLCSKCLCEIENGKDGCHE